MEISSNSIDQLLVFLNAAELQTTGTTNGTTGSNRFLELEVSDARTLIFSIGISLVLCLWFQLLPKPILRAAQSLRIILEDALLVVFCAVILLSLGAPYGVVLLWRSLVHVYLKISHGELGGLVEPLDVVGTLDTPNSRQIIKALKVLEGNCDLEKLRSSCSRTVGRKDANGKLVFPKFYQQLGQTCGFFCWKPANLDITHHVRFVQGLEMDSVSQSESQTLRLISHICNEEFEAGRPSWEILVVPKFHYDHESPAVRSLSPKFGIIIRIHHSIGDGYSLLKLILKDMAGEPNIPAIPVSDKPMMPLWYGTLIFFYLTFKSPRTLIREMMIHDRNPLHKTKGVITGRKSLVWSQPIRLDFFKETKTKMDTGMSTLLLAALAGALRKFMLQEYGEVPDQVSAVLPFPAPNHPNDKMTNKFSLILFPLDCQTDDPIATTKQIEKAGKQIASAPDALINLFLMTLGGTLPVPIMRFFLTNSQATLIVSNLPGPTRDISIWGSKLIDTMFWLPSLGDSGVSVSFLSYANYMRIGLTTDSGVILDGQAGTQRLLQLIIDGLLEMAKTVNVSTENIFRPTIDSFPIHEHRPLFSHMSSLTDNSNSSEQSDLESENDPEEEERYRTYYLHGNESSEDESKSPIYENKRNNAFGKLSHQRQYSSFVQKVPGKLMHENIMVRSKSATAADFS